MTDISLNNYYYGAQLRNYIIQFMTIFSGLKVKIGKNDFDSQTDKIEVPIQYGSKDRVVAAILSEGTQNKPVRVPTLAANVIGIELMDNLRVGVGQVTNSVHLPLGQTLPDGLVNVVKYRPVPYLLRMELTVYASNTDQHFQMLEQIMMLFDPVLQIQISDAYQDAAKITTVTMESIGLEEEYPPGNSRRIITSSLQFSLPIQISPPYNMVHNYIKSVQMRLAIIANGNVDDAVKHIDDFSPLDMTLFDIKDMNIPAK